MDTLNISNSKTRKSPSPAKTNAEYQPQLRKSVMLNESELDSNMKHWEEFKVKGIKIPRRSYHSAAVHGQSLYIYGGYEVNAGNLEDFYKVNLDPNNTTFEWEEVSANSQLKPGPRSRHSAVVYQDKMYLYGGQTNSVSNTNKLFSFDFTKKEWALIAPKTDSPVPSIDSHLAILWEEKGSMIVVGGFLGGNDGGYSNGVYEYDIKENQWRVLFQNKEVDITGEQKPSIPQGRTGLGAAISRDCLYIFGGNEGNTKLNDIWKFDLRDKKWSSVTVGGQTIPEPRNGHSLVCYKDKLVLFGGILDITHEKNDIFIFSIQKSTWIAAEKETKWVMDNDKGTSPPKKGLEDSKTKERSNSPHRKNVSYSKHAQGKVDYSMDLSEDGNSPSKDKSMNATMGGTNRSPSKYTKLKLLESPTKGNPLAMALGGTEDSSSPNKQSSLKSSLQEKSKRDKLLKKMMLLKEFEVENDQAKDLTVVNPALEAMQNSIKGLGLGDDTKDKAENSLSVTMAGLDAIRAQADKPTDSENSIKVGAKPVARDGHSASVIGEKMFIFGGDRHKMPFNDLFALNLKFIDSVNI